MENNEIKCAVCGELFDASSLVSVAAHEHNPELNPAECLGVVGRKLLGPDLYPDEGPQFWAGVNSFISGEKLDYRGTEEFKRGYLIHRAKCIDQK